MARNSNDMDIVEEEDVPTALPVFEIKHQTPRIDAYQFVRELGSGAQGEVYLYKRKADGATKVIKRIRKVRETGRNDAAVKSAIEQVLMERKILNRVRPQCARYVVCFDEYFEDFANHYLVMEYVRGTLLLDKKPVDNTRLFSKISRNLVEGLKVIHSLGVAHRDIKPENVMCDNDGEVKYIDFGFSCVDQFCSARLPLAGTSDFMAWELYDTPNPNHQKADIWALGCTLMELVIDDSDIGLADIWTAVHNKGVPLSDEERAKQHTQFKRMYQWGDDPLMRPIEDLVRRRIRMSGVDISAMLRHNPAERRLVVS